MLKTAAKNVLKFIPLFLSLKYPSTNRPAKLFDFSKVTISKYLWILNGKRQQKETKLTYGVFVVQLAVQNMYINHEC